MKERTEADTEERKVSEPSTAAGSETERIRAIVDVKHNQAETGESGVPASCAARSARSTSSPERLDASPRTARGAVQARPLHPAVP